MAQESENSNLQTVNKHLGRRGFIRNSLLAAMSTALGTKLMFAESMPPGYLPLAFTEENPFSMKEKHPELMVLNEKPWNVETPPHLLDDEVTPVQKMFIRNNGLVPEKIDAQSWILVIDGESVKEKRTFTLKELQTSFTPHTYQLVLECGGNGRYGFYPAAAGNQWKEGAVSCARWTGVRLRDVLNHVGLKPDAVYIGYYGKDVHLSGDPQKPVISRGVPMKKALEDETLLAWSLNGKDIPLIHGYPLRLVVGGWPASVSGKWIHRIAVRNKVHDGAKMTGDSYRIPIHPVEPGAETPEDQFKIIESMPVRSVITYPKSGAIIKKGRSLQIRGHAWAGDHTVTRMDYSIDYGATWQTCQINNPVNRLSWQRWTATVNLPDKGYYEVWARATDSDGKTQPMVVPAWNPGGYLNNSCHRIAVKVD